MDLDADRCLGLLFLWAFLTQDVQPQHRAWAILGLNILMLGVPFFAMLMLLRTAGRGWLFLVPSAALACIGAAYVWLYGRMAINDVWL